MPPTLPRRRDVPSEQTWDLASIFPSDAAWEAAADQLPAAIAAIARFEGHVGDSAAMLADWFAARAELVGQLERSYIYANLTHYSDMTDQDAAARNSRAAGLYSSGMAALAFAEAEILQIPAERLDAWLQDEPRLAEYAHYLDRLARRRAHVRSAEVEQLLGQLGDPFASAVQTPRLLINADLHFAPARTAAGEQVEVAQSSIFGLATAPDREVRRTAWQSYGAGYAGVAQTLASGLITAVKQNVFLARARRYDSALEAALDVHQIPVAVYRTVLDTCTRHLPVWHRYWRVRKQALGYDTLHRYDEAAPLARQQTAIPYDRALELLAAGLAPLGEEYVAVFRRGLGEQRWADRSSNQGKVGGAFSSGVRGTHPFLLLNYNDDLASLSVLAHELGHSMHSYYTWQSQPLIYGDYSLFVAETASNFNQALLRAHLLGTLSDPEAEIAVIDEAMANFHRYFFVMPLLARFELELYEQVERGAGLGATLLSEQMVALLREGYGPDVALDPEIDGILWAQFPHLYANFYVFQYATGLAAANALAAGVIREGAPAAERYVAFLKAGDSRYPLDALKLAGVDMSTAEPIEQTFAVLTGMIDRLERLTQQRAAGQ